MEHHHPTIVPDCLKANRGAWRAPPQRPFFFAFPQLVFNGAAKSRKRPLWASICTLASPGCLQRSTLFSTLERLLHTRDEPIDLIDCAVVLSETRLRSREEALAVEIHNKALKDHPLEDFDNTGRQADRSVGFCLRLWAGQTFVYWADVCSTPFIWQHAVLPRVIEQIQQN